MNAVRAVLVALLLGWAFPALADVAVPQLVGRVVDQTGTLSPSNVDTLNQTIRAFEARKGSQVAVLIVPTTSPETIEQYSLRVAEAWKIGRKKIDDGVLLVIAKNDRKLRIEVGYGLEGALTDVTSKRIIDEIITPKFRSGDFAGGISAGVDRILRVVEGEKLPAPPQREQTAPQQGLQPTWLLEHVNPLNPFTLVFIFVIGAIMRSTLGRLIGAVATGSIVGVLAWFFLASLELAVLAGAIVFVIALFGDFPTQTSSGGRSSSGWSGGGGSSDWSSSSSSSSDSGGGGGSFGGGGASGSW
jgi:uncharacterized protein